MANNIDKSIKHFIASKQDRKLDFSHHSHARLGLGHAGGHLPISAWLDLQADFAQAKDAVFSSLDTEQFTSLCHEMNLISLEVQSQANDAKIFLLRPDLGRLLAKESETRLACLLNQHAEYTQRDILIVVSGGLSPIAVQKQAPHFLRLLIDKARSRLWTLSPLIINPKGRVALGDQINYYFKAKITIMLIGERPGLTTPDSMGIYFTYQAKPGCTDEQRNCISNIHERGLPHNEAAEKLVNLINKSMTLHMSGIELKDDVIKIK